MIIISFTRTWLTIVIQHIQHSLPNCWCQCKRPFTGKRESEDGVSMATTHVKMQSLGKGKSIAITPGNNICRALLL